MFIDNKLSLKENFSIKYLTVGKRKTGGRNFNGRITSYHRGGGHKQLIRIVDYYRYIWNIYGIVRRITYDPNRNALLALIVYSNGLLSYIIATSYMKVGDRLLTAEIAPITEGNCMYLLNIPIGVKINSVEITPNCGAQYVRAAGTYARIIAKTNYYAIIKFRSNVRRKVPLYCLATIGIISNFNYMFRKFISAGASRHRGKRPVVRGVAMNPIDHPHGGGQGKTSGGRPSVSPWGLITKGRKTSGKYNLHLIIKEKWKRTGHKMISKAKAKRFITK